MILKAPRRINKKKGHQVITRKAIKLIFFFNTEISIGEIKEIMKVVKLPQ